MFISKRHLSRRTFLRGAGATLGLPLLEAMVPAGTALAQTPAQPKPRFVGVFFPHGMAPGYWIPETEGALTKLPTIMEPLEHVKDQAVILSGMWSKSAEPPEGTTGSDHWVAAAFMTGIKPKKTIGSDASVGTPTIDQTIAMKIGQETPLPSLQLAVEDPGATSSNCGEGYSCSYTNTISWTWSNPARWNDPKENSGTTPLPMELNPQIVFERLFGSGASVDERIFRRRQSQSILDSVLGELTGLKKDLGARDKLTVDQYTNEIREIERRLQIAAKISTVAPTSDAPTGIPDSWDEHIKLHYDLTRLAFQADVTRVATLLGARDLTGRTYPYPKSEWFPQAGTTGSFHGLSHHAENPATIRQYSTLNRYHVSTMSYFAEKLKATPDGDGTLLDHSLILYGTNMGNSNQHQHYNVPHILVGGASGQLKGGRHLAYPTKTITTGNLLLSVLDMFGIHQDSQGDSTGRLVGL
ncbi:MAG TPA: DUF1552 domain-containing protein [Terriglobia bacterium]|nr:DUF1552 domain-containing protein [Terriglobia bacterium]